MSVRLSITLAAVRRHFLYCQKCYDNWFINEQFDLYDAESRGLNREPIMRKHAEKTEVLMRYQHSITQDGIKYVPVSLEQITSDIKARIAIHIAESNARVQSILNNEN